MTRNGQWVPSNRTTVRICVQLLQGYRDKRAALGFNDFLTVREGTFRTSFNWNLRIYLGRLWARHGGLELARATDRYDRLPQDVVDDLNESACA